MALMSGFVLQTRHLVASNGFHTSAVSSQIIKLTRLRVVDNSEIGKTAMAEGKPPKCIHVYNKKGVGTVGKYRVIYILGAATDGCRSQHAWPACRFTVRKTAAARKHSLCFLVQFPSNCHAHRRTFAKQRC